MMTPGGDPANLSIEDRVAYALSPQVEIAAYWKSLGITQMLSQGSEGYRAVGPYDPRAPTTYPCACPLRSYLDWEGRLAASRLTSRSQCLHAR
jgi:hypothetical protein